MCGRLSIIAGLPLIIGATVGETVTPAACDPLVSSDRLADTYVPDDMRQFAPQVVAETYFLPLPRACPRTPAGYSRWDLCR